MAQQDEHPQSDTLLLGPEDISTADLARNKDQPSTATIAHGLKSKEEGSAEPLFPQKETQELREKWQSIQAGFVDEPRRAVQEADGLVAAAMKRLAEVFSDERDRLESQWDRGDDVSTEDLRVALTRYRSFFHRLLSM